MARELRAKSTDYVLAEFPLEEAPSALPIRGKPYLMMGSSGDGQFFITKAVDPTAENLDIVLKVIRKRGLALNNEPTDPTSGEGKPISTPFLLAQLQKKTPVVEQDDTVGKDLQASTPWSLIALIAAAIGLLWLLLKRRA